MIPDRIEERIRTAYARPRISDAWLDQCCTHLIEAVGLDPVADEDNFYSSVEQHFLFSSLRESTDPGTGFALSDVFTEGFGTNDVPVLVEVSDMTDVGISAFDLILKWNERASAFPGTFPPSYPRGMLKVHLSDGHEERLAAEIKYISTLILGETPLGTKILLKNVDVDRGYVFLHPDKIEVKGGQNSLDQFRTSWTVELGRSLTA